MPSPRTIMIIGAGFLQVPVIETARRMGLTTVVTDYDPDAPGLKYADIAIIASTRDHEGTVRHARKYVREGGRIDGVLTVGTDASMTVAAVAAALNLPGNKFETAEAATNKIKMRQRFQAHNVPSPDFRECWDINDIYDFIKSHTFPLVIKPSDNMGARGVRKIESQREAEHAFQEARDASPSGECLIEEYIDGEELSIDALVYNDDIIFTGIADRIIAFPPHFVEIGHIMPSIQPAESIRDACDVMRKGIKALGITHGAAKGDIKITPQGAVIGELAARLSGGFMSTHTFPLSSGIDLMKAMIQIALGQKPDDIQPRHHYTAYEHALIPQPGYIESIEGIDETLALEGVKHISIRVHPGERIELPRSNVEKAGNIIVIGKDRKEALARMEQALTTVSFVISATAPVNHNEIRRRAKHKFGSACSACIICDGKKCIGEVPGMGSVGTGSSFMNNITALKKVVLIPRYLHESITVATQSKILGYTTALPLLAAPITGTDVNMNNALDEQVYADMLVTGCNNARIIAMVGDGALPDMYRIGLNALEHSAGSGIAIFKPRQQQSDIISRIVDAEKAGCLAVGCDIDAGAFTTLLQAGQAVGPKSESSLRELIDATSLPFIVKGIMSVQDTEIALRAGAKVIYISNHGGRVMDHMPGTLDVLREIASVVKNDAEIWIDGGIRTGEDIFKCIALGAHAVCIGRPLAIAAVGGGENGVAFTINEYQKQLKKVMLLMGCATISDISADHIRYI